MIRVSFTFLFCMALLSVYSAEPTVWQLWPASTLTIDTTAATEPQEMIKDGVLRIRHVQNPELYIFAPPPEKRNGRGMVICPGGAYSILAWDKEGTEVADFFTARGYVCGVLKYRVPSSNNKPRWENPVQDATRALELFREHAGELGVATNRVGVLGFSAGADMSLRAALADSALNAGGRPGFLILIYPAYQLKSDDSLRDDFHLPRDAPPAFFIHARNDPHKSLASERLHEAWQQAGIPSDILLFEKGGHGFGMRGDEGSPGRVWPERSAEWLDQVLAE